MAKLKRVLLILLIFLGPGSIIYFISRTVSNHFIDVPYVGYEYEVDSNGVKIDSLPYTIPDFELVKFDGTRINRDSIKDKFIVLSTLQNDCPTRTACGINTFLFNEIFFHKLVKNQKNYGNVKVISILTDLEGNAVDSISPKLIEEMAEFDQDIWWMTTGSLEPFFGFDYYGKKFMEHESVEEAKEVGTKAFINSLVLIDKDGHIRGVAGAKTDSDIRNFFDVLKLLKKVEFDANRAARK
jgi:cytochrome oxidase Cu insertion factor (SCO1/SenC/PrrC family)